jgi:Holliday junction resolvase RusA-like endonuclease
MEQDYNDEAIEELTVQVCHAFASFKGGVSARFRVAVLQRLIELLTDQLDRDHYRLVVDLPMPPSVNRIWRARKAGKLSVSISPQYSQWLDEADSLVMSMGALRGAKTIPGPFKALLQISDAAKKSRSDLDNRHKAVLDYAETRFMVANDRHLQELTIKWAPKETCAHGARLTLTELSS